MNRHFYLALGDSVTAGHNATHPNLTFVRQVSNFTENAQWVDRTIVIARNGWTTRDMIHAASIVPRTVWDQTKIVTLIAGGNDLRKLLRRQYVPILGEAISPQVVARKVEEYRANLDLLCKFIGDREIPHEIVATMYNPAPHFPLATDAIRALNETTRSIANHYRFGIVDIYQKFHGNEAYYIEGYRNGRFEDLLSPIRRPIHPNNAGHREIANLITKHLSRNIRTSKKTKRQTNVR